jgi:hypothetical protein
MTPGHPLFDRLVDLVKGDLSNEQQAEIAGHIATCSKCAADVAWLEHVLDLYRTGDAVSPPASESAYVRGLFRSAVGSQGMEQLRRILAVLTFDSMHMPLTSNMRSEMGTKRQLVFQAAEFDLDMHIASSGSECIISGQVLGSTEGGQAELRGSTGSVQAPLNDLSQFTLPPVAAGIYTLSVRLKDVVIVVPSLEIGT